MRLAVGRCPGEDGRVDVWVRGVRIAYDEVGSGPVAVRVHGLTGSRAQDDVTGAFAAGPLVGIRLSVLRYDVRGHGRSGGEPVATDYVWTNLADDLLALLDALEVERVSGVGASMGTAILLHAATTAPERFGRLVLTCPPTAWESRAPEREAMREAAESVDSGGKRSFEASRQAQARPPALAEQPLGPVDIDESLLAAVLRGAAESDLPAQEALTRIGCPTLVLAWADDPGHPVSTAHRLCEFIPDSTLHVATTPDELRSWDDLMAAFLR
jgi:3-oxoadipate enol-lactonase